MTATRTAAARDPAAILFAAVLLLGLAEFGQVWFYPAAEAGAELTRPFGGAFRTTLWVAATACILAHLLRRGAAGIVWALGPFLPFMLWGAAVVVFWSIDRSAGVRTLVFWSLATGLAAAAAVEIGPRALARTVALMFLAVVAGSLVVAGLVPDSATTAYGDAAAIRGLFPHKNAFGWFCAIGLIWTAGTRRDLGMPLAALTAFVMAAGLLVSGSRTAAAMLPAVAAYGLLLRLCLRVFWNGARAVLALVILAVAAGIAALLVGPQLLEIVGRDATLTGRTEVWRHYLAYLHDRPLTGYGTGILSSDTELNRAVGGAVPGYEAQGLRSPHSLYVGLASETGLVGVAFFVAAQAYIALVTPFRRLTPWSRTSGALAVAILLAGISEMRDGFIPGAATLLLVAARAAALRQSRLAAEAR